MSLNNFIPEIWAEQLLRSLKTKLVYGQPGVINRDYQGQIQQGGDTVRITMVGDPTIGNYTKDTNMAAPETLTDAQSALTITEQKYFNFQVDQIDQVQGNVAVIAEGIDRAAYKLAKTADSFIAGKYTEMSAAAGNVLGTDASAYVVGTASGDKNAYSCLVDLSVILDENDVPEDGRWVVVPAWYYGLLLKDDRFTKSGTPQGDLVKANGSVGKDVPGLMVLKSNQVPNTSGALYKIIAGHGIGWSFAEQIPPSTVKEYEPELRFAKAYKGLHLYGGKVVRPQLFGTLTASKGTL